MRQYPVAKTPYQFSVTLRLTKLRQIESALLKSMSFNVVVAEAIAYICPCWRCRRARACSGVGIPQPAGDAPVAAVAARGFAGPRCRLRKPVACLWTGDGLRGRGDCTRRRGRTPLVHLSSDDTVFAVLFVVTKMTVADVWAVGRWLAGLYLGTELLLVPGFPDTQIETGLMWEFVYSAAAGVVAGIVFEGAFRRRSE
jgi:hypothetical protein